MTATGSSIAVVGAGYVGLTTGVCLAELGHQVGVLEIDPERVASLSEGRVPFYEANMPETLKKHLDAGTIRFSSTIASIVSDAEFVFLCVQSPAAEDGTVDTSALVAAAESIAPHLAANSVVVNKSTVPVGSAERVHAIIGRDDVDVASNPEFLREGTAIADFMKPDRIVIGAGSTQVQQRVASLYKSVDTDLMLTNPATAELIKYVCNAYLATRLSFVNDVGELCEQVGGDMPDLVRAMGLDKRIGPHFLKPGPGWGGSCFPKDTTALDGIAAAAGHDFRLLREVVDSNQRQFDRIARRALAALAASGGGRIAVWGLSFKTGTDDTRSSPALEVVRRLLAAGVEVVGYDPRAEFSADGFTQVADALSAVTEADLLVVLTGWPQFGEVDPGLVATSMTVQHVFDTRGVLDLNRWATAGFVCEAIGRLPS